MKFEIAKAEDAVAIRAMDPQGFVTESRQDLLSRRIHGENAFVLKESESLLVYALRDRFFGFDFLELLFVNAESRRGGVGSAMIRYLETLRRSPRLFISTNTSNGPMRALLAKVGYAPSGMVYNIDPGDPELVFVKRFDGVPVETPDQCA